MEINFKKALCCLLAIVMCVGLFAQPIFVFANGDVDASEDASNTDIGNQQGIVVVTGELDVSGDEPQNQVLDVQVYAPGDTSCMQDEPAAEETEPEVAEDYGIMTVAATATPAPTTKPGTEGVDETYNVRAQFYSLVTAARQENDCEWIEYDAALQNLAITRSREIAEKYSHTRPNGESYKNMSSRLTDGGENINRTGTTAQEAFDALYTNSAGKANILNNNFKSMAVACWHEKTDDTYYWAQIFSTSLAQDLLEIGTPKPPEYKPEWSDEVFVLINQRRASLGLIPYEYDDNLQDIANTRAFEQVTKWGHERPDGSHLGDNYLLGENLAKGQTSPQNAFDAWIASPAHRGAIDSDVFKSTALSCYHDASQTARYFWVEVFSYDYAENRRIFPSDDLNKTAVATVDGVPYGRMDQALAAMKAGSTFKLMRDYVSKVDLTFGVNGTVDMNGKTITFTDNAKNGFVASGALTVSNGVINSLVEGSASSVSAAVTVSNGGNLTLNNVSVTGSYHAIHLTSTGNNSVTTGKDGLITNTGKASVIFADKVGQHNITIGNKVTSQPNAKYPAIETSSANTSPNNITINGTAVISGTIYELTPGTLAINKGANISVTTNGTSCISITKGNLIVSDGVTIRNTSSGEQYAAGSGNTLHDGGAAIFIEPTGTVTVTINGGTISSSNSAAVYTPADNGNLTLTINDGTFDGQYYTGAVNANGKTGYVYGGSYSSDISGVVAAGNVAVKITHNGISRWYVGTAATTALASAAAADTVTVYSSGGQNLNIPNVSESNIVNETGGDITVNGKTIHKKDDKPACKHNNKKNIHEKYKAPECTTDGYYEAYQCLDEDGCNGKYYKDEACTQPYDAYGDWVIPALGHDLVQIPMVPSTCSKAGTEPYWTCQRCHKKWECIKTEIGKDEDNHTLYSYGAVNYDALFLGEPGTLYFDYNNHNVIEKSYIAPTCTTEGRQQHWECPDCNRWWYDAELQRKIQERDHDKMTLAPTGHDMTEHPATEVTCENGGNELYYTCNNCLVNFADNQGNQEVDLASVITPPGHTFGSYSAKINPTYETDGQKEYWQCGRCNKYFADGSFTIEIPESDLTIPRLYCDHDEVTEHPYVAPTCETPGNNVYYECNECHMFSGTEDMREVTNTATTFAIPANGHSFVPHYPEAPTCDTDGNKMYWSCENCTKVFSSTDPVKETTLSETIDPKHHDLVEVPAAEATCEKGGNDTYWHCNACQKNFVDDSAIDELIVTETTPALGHNYEMHDYKEATCTEDGWKAHETCDRCGKYFIDREEVEASEVTLQKTGHNLEEHERKEGTCLEPGNIQFWFCNNCRKLFRDRGGHDEITELSEVVLYGDHVLGEHETQIDPTYDTNGRREYWKCSVCGKFFTNEEMTDEIAENGLIIPKLNCLHDSYSTHEATDATCEANGNKLYYECDTCHAIGKDAEFNELYDSLADTVIPANGHSFHEHDYKEETCDEDGNIHYWSCDNCEKVFTNIDLVVETQIEQTVIAKHHVPTPHAKQEATCEDTGVEAYWQCDRCQKMFSNAECTDQIEEPVIIDALGHSLIDVEERQATCEEAGTQAFQCCERCNKRFLNGEEVDRSQLRIEPLGHEKVEHEAKDATCDEDGNIKYWSCNRCDKLFKGDNGDEPATESEVFIKGKHAISFTQGKDATCEEDGYQQYWKCDTCGKYFLSEDTTEAVEWDTLVIKAYGHNTQAYEAREATCETNGIKAHEVCNRCNKYFMDGKEVQPDDVIEAPLGHKTVEHPAKNATCEEDGNSLYYSCERCDKVFKDENAEEETSMDLVVIHGGHKLTMHPAVEATCDTDGNIQYWECDVCNHLFKDDKGEEPTDLESVVEPKHHGEIEHVQKKDATATEEGNVEYWHCPNCDRYFANEDLTETLSKDAITIPPTSTGSDTSEESSESTETSGSTETDSSETESSETDTSEESTDTSTSTETDTSEESTDTSTSTESNTSSDTNTSSETNSSAESSNTGSDTSSESQSFTTSSESQSSNTASESQTGNSSESGNSQSSNTQSSNTQGSNTQGTGTQGSSTTPQATNTPVKTGEATSNGTRFMLIGFAVLAVIGGAVVILMKKKQNK